MTSNEKFWAYSSGKAEINVVKLYQYLHKKGYRYYQASVKDPIYVILVKDNNVRVILEFANICQLCLSLIDQDFSSLSENERVEVKSKLKAVEHSFRKKQLAHFKPEDLNSIKESGDKHFLMTLNEISLGEKGGTL